MRTLIVGLGKSGLAAYELLVDEGDEVVGVDDNPLTVKKCLDEGKKAAFDVKMADFDRVILSPGVPAAHRWVKEAGERGLPILGEAELALKRLSHLALSRAAIGITGTNGKTTVTLLVAHILQAAGLSAPALGNVGVPLCSYVKKAQPGDIFVIELSSYQLETLSMPLFDVGLILNVTPDHLDRYGSMRPYAEAKCCLQDCMKSGGAFWVHESVAAQFKELLKRDYQTYGRNRDCTLWTDQVALLRNSSIETFLPPCYRNWGAHESENVLSAWIACKPFDIRPEQFLRAVETFKKPAHRIEWVACIDGVEYINDSKGTNIDATIKAVMAMKGKVVLIVGGVDKGAAYHPWKPLFTEKVRHVIAIGEAAHKIAQDLKPEFQVEIVSDLKEAVLRSKAVAKQGDSVLLSPGCASLDMFKNYADRGENFKCCVYQAGGNR